MKQRIISMILVVCVASMALKGADTDQVSIDGLLYELNVNSLTAKVLPSKDENREAIQLPLQDGRLTIPASVLYDNRIYSVTQIADNALSFQRDVTTIEFLSNELTFGEGVGYNCPNLKSITFPLKVGNEIFWAFNACDNLENIVLPAEYVTSGAYNIRDSFIPSHEAEMPSIKVIESRSVIPPNVDIEALPEDSSDSQTDNTDADQPQIFYSSGLIGDVDTVVYVPEGCGDTYRAHNSWNEYKQILETNFAGISRIKDDNNGSEFIIKDGYIKSLSNTPYEVFDLKGIKINSFPLQPGVYLIQTKTATTKVVIK